MAVTTAMSPGGGRLTGGEMLGDVDPAGWAAPRHEWLHRYGPFVLAVFLLATSKWGSYLPTGSPPFVADLGFAVLLGDRVLGAAAHRGFRVPKDSWLCLVAAALFALSAGWFVLGPWSVTSVRDAAPYLYVVLVFLVCPPTAAGAARLDRVITAALVFHAAWCTGSLLVPGLVDAMPKLGGALPLFITRGDFDGMVSGLLAGIALYRVLAGRGVALNLALFGWSVGLTLALGSRGGLLSLVGAIAVGGLLGRRRRDGGPKARRWAVALLLLVVPAALPLAAQGQAFERLSASVTNLWRPTSDVAGAEGTANARYETWGVLTDWISQDPVRDAVGVGFGPNFLVDSRADVTLFGGGIDAVRSPHNYLIGTWARLGLLGLATAVGLTLAGWRLAWLVARGTGDLGDVDLLAVLLAVTMPLVAFVGVVLESPFGAVPYFWALGHLGAVACARGHAAPLGARRLEVRG